MKQFIIGTDVETMILDNKGGIQSAIPIIGLNRKHKLPEGEVYHDNMNLEFTVTPAKNKDEFTGNIAANITAIQKILAKKKFQLAWLASAHYPKEQIDCEEARVFGCEPDFDPYTMMVNQPDENPAESTLRSCGGHVHFSHPWFGSPEEQTDEALFERAMKVVNTIKLMDLTLGIPSIVIDSTEESVLRRRLYGNAGAHRPKDEYPGGEYRALSNFWCSKPELISWVYDATERAIALAVEGKTQTDFGIEGEGANNVVRDIINENDIDAAKALIAKLDIIQMPE
jgi:hypothetical protein